MSADNIMVDFSKPFGEWSAMTWVAFTAILVLIFLVMYAVYSYLRPEPSKDSVRFTTVSGGRKRRERRVVQRDDV
jgi:predicted small integral membrane protein